MTDYSHVYANTVASLGSFNKSIRTYIEANSSATLRLVDFDAYPSEPQLPQENLLGHANHSIEVVDRILEVEVMIGISLLKDVDNFDLHKYCALLFKKISPMTNVPYVDSETGATLGQFVIRDGVKAMPVANAERPSRFFMLQLSSVFKLDYPA